VAFDPTRTDPGAAMEAIGGASDVIFCVTDGVNVKVSAIEIQA